MKMKKVGIIGATGYAGVELIRILLSHPEVEIAGISSVSFEGKKISEVYPAFKDIFDNVLTAEDDVIENCDVIFASLPHGLSEKIAKKVDAKGKILIDLGADFRLYDEADYTEWYGLNYEEKELHKKAIYALPEIFRNDIKGKKIIGNPGCYPTSVALALAPALAGKLISTNAIIIDSKSGVTGAGRGLTQKTHYPDCNEAFSPYKVASHRHTPEIEQTLSAVAGSDVKITFVPHLLPLNRGIVSTIYADLVKDVDLDELISIYKYY
ncbi:MAG: N-acetyl-gamma-glutamyl-phosphate reductase, partial [Oscillospiraceae bacterium]|nr:N-acetyl-gamma-glutamyl-phosphate reductase [Oscillospiraceae bacterium]